MKKWQFLQQFATISPTAYNEKRWINFESISNRLYAKRKNKIKLEKKKMNNKQKKNKKRSNDKVQYINSLDMTKLIVCIKNLCFLVT